MSFWDWWNTLEPNKYIPEFDAPNLQGLAEAAWNASIADNLQRLTEDNARLTKAVDSGKVCAICWTSGWTPVETESECNLNHPHEGEHRRCECCWLHKQWVENKARAEKAEAKCAEMSKAIRSAPTPNIVDNTLVTLQERKALASAVSDWHHFYGVWYHNAQESTSDNPSQALLDERDRLRARFTRKIVCLCGSTRFYEAFQKANYDETMKGNIILTVGFYPHSSEQAHGEHIGTTAEIKEALDETHKRKIDLCDEVLVLNVDGYIGSSTRSEIEYAKGHGKPIRYLEQALAKAGKEVK